MNMPPKAKNVITSPNLPKSTSPHLPKCITKLTQVISPNLIVQKVISMTGIPHFLYSEIRSHSNKQGETWYPNQNTVYGITIVLEIN